MRRILSLFLAGIVLATGIAGEAVAQGFPSKPIRLIVPYGAGGPADVMARFFSREMAPLLGHPILVDNVPGASSTIGMAACANAPPDGHTICLTVPDSLSYNPLLYRNLPYNATSGFAPVIQLTRANAIIVANGSAPFSSLKELLDYAKQNPGKLNFGTWGAATLPDVYRQWFDRKGGVSIVGIPYKSAAAAMNGVLAEEVNLTFITLGFALPHIRTGKLKPIAVTGSTRAAAAPGIPSLGEFGLDPGLGSYFGVFAPARTPPAIVAQLNSTFAKVIATPAGQEFLRAQTMEPVGAPAEAFADYVRRDQARAAELFQFLGIEATANPQ